MKGDTRVVPAWLDPQPVSEPGGVKHDRGKPRASLVPVEFTELLLDHYAQGAVKYGDRNWEKGIAFSRIYDAMQRHLLAWWSGEDEDPEGFQHLTAVAWGAAALVTFRERGMAELDDRPTKRTT